MQLWERTKLVLQLSDWMIAKCERKEGYCVSVMHYTPAIFDASHGLMTNPIALCAAKRADNEVFDLSGQVHFSHPGNRILSGIFMECLPTPLPNITHATRLLALWITHPAGYYIADASPCAITDTDAATNDTVAGATNFSSAWYVNDYTFDTFDAVTDRPVVVATNCAEHWKQSDSSTENDVTQSDQQTATKTLPQGHDSQLPINTGDGVNESARTVEKIQATRMHSLRQHRPCFKEVVNDVMNTGIEAPENDTTQHTTARRITPTTLAQGHFHTYVHICLNDVDFSPIATRLTCDLSSRHNQQTKRGKAAETPTVSDLATDPKSVVGKRVAKYFQTGDKELQLFFGTVTQYVQGEERWRIDYDDGDFEELIASHLRLGLKQYKKQKHEDTENAEQRP
jgi:hypothetical protein